jgi:hypothetical protein
MICGVPPEKVIRFASPLRHHRVYLIDTREVQAYRAAHGIAATDVPFLEGRFKF